MANTKISGSWSRRDGVLKRPPLPPLEMRPSVVAVIDALGFKDVWRRVKKAEEVVDALRRAKHDALGNARLLVTNGTLEIASFSDTIIATCQQKGDDALRDIAQNLAFVIGSMCETAATATVPLAYRGCIAVGDLAVSDEYFVGPAIDEASQWHEQADAAITWVTPEASQRIGLLDEPTIYFLEWPLPLKTGGPITVMAVNPLWTESISEPAFAHEPTGVALDGLVERLLVPLRTSTRIDVVRKLQNTQAFLRAARAHTVRLMPAEVATFDEEVREHWEAETRAAQENGEAEMDARRRIEGENNDGE